MSSDRSENPAELETFLPRKETDLSDTTIIKLPITEKDDNLLPLSYTNEKLWDPFKARKVEHPTTDCETLTHLMKASAGTGILAMPLAFKSAGLAAGVVLTLLVSIICTHCAYILVKCAHKLYYKTKVSRMSFVEVGEAAFANGPSWCRRYSKSVRMLILGSLFVTYFSSCSVFTVIIAQSFQQVVEHHTGIQLNIRIYISGFLIPLVILSWVPNLKYLAPVSMVANILMSIALGITFYYVLWDLPSPSSLPQIAPVQNMPQFFSITIFAMEAIGVMMPLENNMKTPQHFTGICGVLNQGMSGVTLVYIFLGFFGYLKYGDSVLGSITLNLPTEEYAAQSVKILITIAIFCTYGLTYYVAFEIVWNAFKDRYQKQTKFAEYFVRTLLTVCAVAVAIAVPTIGPFIGLIGALCFSFLGLIVPVLIEIVTYWDNGFGPGNWIIWKNIFIVIFGLMAMMVGSYFSILDIFKEFARSEPEIVEQIIEID